jgi:hypothetical protein
MPTARAARAAPQPPTPVCAPAPTHARLATTEDIATASPARALQNEVVASFAEPDIGTRWSPRRTLAFTVGTCGLFWIGLYFAIRAL